MTTIIAGVDASEEAAVALSWAAVEARLRGAALLAVHAYRVPPAYVHDELAVARIDPELHQQAEAVLDRALRHAGDLAEVRVVRRLQPGRPSGVLIGEASAGDLLVLGRRGAGGFADLLLGSTAEHCAAHAPSPVVVVPAPPRATRGLVVVGVDGSVASHRALAWALEHARRRGSRLEIVTVRDTYTARGPFGAEFMKVASPASERRFREHAEQVVEEALEAVAVTSDLDLRTSIPAGHPAEVLIERTRDADLVALGSRGLGGFRGLLLGSVSRQLLHHASCPVAIVRG
jgi:nucleotide-binding universal stress UspA family protein